MLTPFTEAGEVDFDAHVRNLKRWNGESLCGYLVLGSNSETPYLNETEKLKLVELTTAHAASGRIVLAGTGLESTSETIRLTNCCAELGAHGALVLTPSYYGKQMNDDALIGHYHRIADASRIPILIYNVPVYTKLNISVDAVCALSEHPNIVGIKESSGEIPRLAMLMNGVAPSFSLILGTAAAWYPALTLGIRMAILALANFAGSACSLVQQHYDTDRRDEARSLYLKLLPVNTAITSTYGIAGLKHAATLLGYEGCCVRRPLCPLGPEAQQRIRDALSRAELL